MSAAITFSAAARAAASARIPDPVPTSTNALAAQVEAADEFGEVFAAEEIPRMEHCRAHDETKAADPRDPGPLPGENQMIGKEVNQTTQAAAEGTVRDASAAKDLHSPPSLDSFESVIHEQVDS